MRTMLVVCLVVLLQDPTEADLAKAVTKTRKAESYRFTYARKRVGRKDAKAANVEGVYADRVLYLKHGKIEIAHGGTGTLVRLDGGEWTSFSLARAALKSRKQDDPDPETPMDLDALSKIPAPHTLIAKFQTWVPRVKGSGADHAVFTGALTSSAARTLQEEEWFHLEDTRRVTSPQGNGRATTEDGWVTGVDLGVEGKLQPGTEPVPQGGNRRPPPRNPPQNPRQARRYDTPEVQLGVQIRLTEHDKAELPLDEDVKRKLGVKEKSK